MKEVFTTIEAAKICRVSQQTIIRCFDSGKLRGFRVPGSRFRRIPREELLRFLAEYGRARQKLGRESGWILKEVCGARGRKTKGVCGRL